MPADPKQKREVDKKYLKFIRQHSCRCGVGCMGVVAAHHVKTRGAGGSDYETIPLCVKHHAAVHKMGIETFQELYFINFDREIIRLLIEYYIKGGLK